MSGFLWDIVSSLAAIIIGTVLACVAVIALAFVIVIVVDLFKRAKWGD